jgi:transporter family-2 protein
MLASLVADHYGLFGVGQHPMNPSRLFGAGLLLGGVILIRR